jgi:hypothetical protein
MHRTGLDCTSLHRFRATAIFYPNFYPKAQQSGAEMLYVLVIAANWSGRPGCATSLPSWSCGFDSRRPLQFINFSRFGVPIDLDPGLSIGRRAYSCDISTAKLQSSNIVMLTSGWWDYPSFYPKCPPPHGWSCQLESAACSTVMTQDIGMALTLIGYRGFTRRPPPHRPSVRGMRRTVRQRPRPCAASADGHGSARQPDRTSRAFRAAGL